MKSPRIRPFALAAAALGSLDSKAAKAARYTAVGYGTVRASKSGGSNSLGLGWRREYVAQSVNSVSKSWITFSMNPSTGNGGTCYRDSGGPHFTSTGTVVAVTVTGDRYCRSTDKSYRLDGRRPRLPRPIPLSARTAAGRHRSFDAGFGV
jgi:hypothetical protein